MTSGGYAFRSVSTANLQKYALSTDRTAALATMALTDGTDELYLRGLAALQASGTVPTVLLDQLCPWTQSTVRPHDPRAVARHDLECRAILCSSASGGGTPARGDGATQPLQDLDRLLTILSARRLMPALDDRAPALEDASERSAAGVQKKSTLVANDYSDRAFWQFQHAGQASLHRQAKAWAQAHLWQLLADRDFVATVLRPGTQGRQMVLHGTREQVVTGLVASGQGALVASLPGIEDLCLKFMQGQQVDFKSSSPPGWALQHLTLQQLQQLAVAAPHLQLHTPWQEAILLRLQHGKPTCDWDSIERGAFLDRVQSFADGLPESAAFPLAARVAYARLRDAIETAGCPAATLQACLAHALCVLPDACPGSSSLEALLHPPRDWTVQVLDALLQHLLQHPGSADPFLTPPHGAAAEAAAPSRSKLTRLASVVRRTSKGGDSKSAPEAGAASAYLHSLLHPLLQQYLRALVTVLQGCHTTDALRQYSASLEALRSAQRPIYSPTSATHSTVRGGGSEPAGSSLQLLHDARTWSWIQLSAEALVKRPVLAIAPCNPSEVAAASQVVVHVDVKNLPSLAVKVFEISLGEYYKTGSTEELSTLELDGFVPSQEISIPTDPSPAKLSRLPIAVPGLASRRGCFIVDISGGGQTCRAVVLKGALHHLVRQSAAGHAFTLLYEDNTPAESPEVLCNGKKYLPQGSQGEIVVPYSQSGHAVKLILSAGASARRFASAVTLNLPSESYSLLGDIRIERESLAPGAKAPIAVRCKLLLCDRPAPLKLLEDTTLQIAVTDSEGAVNSQTVQPFELQELPSAAVHTLPVPENCRSLTVNLTARVRLVAKGANAEVRYQDVALSHTLDVNGMDGGDSTGDVRLTRLPDGQYAVRVLGRCGEGITNAAVEVSLEHAAWNTALLFNLHTDAHGICALGDLQNISYLRAIVSDSTRHGLKQVMRRWTLARTRHSAPPKVLQLSAVSGQPVRIPYGQTDTECERAGIALVQVVPGGGAGQSSPPLAVLSGAVQLRDGCLVVAPLRPGEYLLCAPLFERPLRIVCVADEGWHGLRAGGVNLRVGGTRALAMSTGVPTHIVTLQASRASGIKVQLPAGAHEAGTFRVDLTLTRFLPEDTDIPSLCEIWPPADPMALSSQWAKPRSKYLASITMGDEARYVMDRRLQAGHKRRHMDALLAKPSLLVDRVEARDAADETVLQARAGHRFGLGGDVEAGRGFAAGSSMAKRRAGAAGCGMGSARGLCGYGGGGGSAPSPSLGASPAAFVLTGLKPDAGGCVMVPADQLPEAASGYTAVTATAVGADGSVATACCALLGCAPPQEQRVIDLRSAHPQAGAALLTRQQHVHACHPGDSVHVKDITSAKMNVVDSAARAYALFAELLACPDLAPAAHPSGTAAAALWAEFGFLPEWRSLDLLAKRARLSSHASHELWFFVKVTDPECFATEVAPLLRQRLPSERDCMTHLLLGDGPALRATAASPQRMAQLSAVERLLLAVALGQASAVEHLRLEASEPHGARAPSPAQLARLRKRFAIALKSGALEDPASDRFLDTDLQEEALADMREYAILGLLEGPPSRTAGGPPLMAAPMAAPRGVRSRGFLPQPARLETAAASSDDLSDVLGAVYDTEDEEECDEGGTDDFQADLLLRAEQHTAPADAGPLRTKEWVEAGYYKVTQLRTREAFTPLSPFWADYAEWAKSNPSAALAGEAAPASIAFVSDHLHEAPTSFTGAVFALALLARSFHGPAGTPKSAPHTQTYRSLSLDLQPSTPAVVFLQAIEPLSEDRQGTPDAAISGIARIVDPSKEPQAASGSPDETRDATVAGPLLRGKVYRLSLVITNMSSREHLVDVVLPCPEGAVPLGGRPLVDVQARRLLPYSCLQLEQAFYFPHCGAHRMAPVSLIKRGALLAWLPPAREHVQVVSELPREGATQIVPGSLQWLRSAQAPDAEVLQALRLATHRLEAADVAWRCDRRQDFFLGCTAALRQRSHYSAAVWKYALKWNDARCTGEWLAVTGSISKLVAAPFVCPILTVDDRDAGLRHKEYWPLVNPRVHTFAGRTHILNRDLEQQWTAFLTFCCRTPALSAEQYVQAAYYLTAMDRLDEARLMLQKCARSATAGVCSMQRDYLKAYLLLRSPAEDLSRVQALVTRNAAVQHAGWAPRWAAMQEHLAVISALAASGEGAAGEDESDARTAAGGQDRSEHLDVDDSELLEGRLTISANPAATPALQLAATAIDVEMLFSSKPFAASTGDRAGSFMQPSAVHSVATHPSGFTTVNLQDLFPGWRTESLMVKVSAGEQCQVVQCFGRTITVGVNVQQGVLTASVRGATGRRATPLPAAYVKVFQMSQNSSKVEFWKDGYTDLLGRFDYCSMSRSVPGGIAKLAVLVSDPDHGSAITEVTPPSFLRAGA